MTDAGAETCGGSPRRFVRYGHASNAVANYSQHRIFAS